MKFFIQINLIPILAILLIVSLFIFSKNAISEEVAATDGNMSGIISNRIDFGNSYIMGQSIKSGAVYLLHRKQSEINSMLQLREGYREEILEDFYIPEEDAAVTAAEDLTGKNQTKESIK